MQIQQSDLENKSALAVAERRGALAKYAAEVAGKTWSTGSLSGEEKKLLVGLCVAYGLRYELGHVEILGGKLYFTHKAYLHKAMNDPRFLSIDGHAIAEATPEHDFWCEYTDERLWKSTVRMKSIDGERIIEYSDFGRAHPETIQMGPIKRFPAEMAKKRAEVRALRGALAIDLVSADELYGTAIVTSAAIAADQIATGRKTDLTRGEKKLLDAVEEPEETLAPTPLDGLADELDDQDHIATGTPPPLTVTGVDEDAEEDSGESSSFDGGMTKLIEDGEAKAADLPNDPDFLVKGDEYEPADDPEAMAFLDPPWKVHRTAKNAPMKKGCSIGDQWLCEKRPGMPAQVWDGKKWVQAANPDTLSTQLIAGVANEKAKVDFDKAEKVNEHPEDFEGPTFGFRDQVQDNRPDSVLGPDERAIIYSKEPPKSSEVGDRWCNRENGSLYAFDGGNYLPDESGKAALIRQLGSLVGAYASAAKMTKETFVDFCDANGLGRPATILGLNPAELNDLAGLLEPESSDGAK